MLETGTLNSHESLTIRLTSQIISGFSILGSFLVFSTYWFFKDNRSFNLELVQYYAFSNLIYSLAAFLPYNPENSQPDFYCALQSFTITMFQNASLLWSSIIGYSAFISIINKNHFDSHKKRYRIFFILISYSLTAAFASIILFTGSYGDSGGWCWIKLREVNKVDKKLVNFFYVLLWFLIILNCFFIFKMISILKTNMNENNTFLMKKLSIMKWYPISQVICMIPATINRVYNLSVDKHYFVLSLLQAIFDSILGVFICIIFLLSPEIKHSLILCFKRLKNARFSKYSGDTSKNIYNDTSDSYIENNFNENLSNYLDHSKRTSNI